MCRRPWHASHGNAKIDVNSQNERKPSLLFTSASVQRVATYVSLSSGVYYQFSGNLDPYKIYTIFYRDKDLPFGEYGSKGMDQVDWYITKGLKPSGEPGNSDDPSNYANWAPPEYPFSKMRIHISGPGDADGTSNWSGYKSFNFTVPDDTYSQLWIHAWVSPTSDKFRTYYLDDLVMTETTGYGPTCTDSVTYNRTQSLPAFTEGNNILVANHVTILSGQNVEFKAANTINLKKEFGAMQGSTFIARIEHCGITAGQRSLTETDRSNSSSITNDISDLHVDIFPNPSSRKFEIQILNDDANNSEVYIIMPWEWE